MNDDYSRGLNIWFICHLYIFVCMYFSVRCIFSVKNCESWTWHVGLFWTTMERAQWMCSAIQKLLHFLRNQTLRPNSIDTLMQEVCLSSLATVAVILATSSPLKNWVILIHCSSFLLRINCTKATWCEWRQRKGNSLVQSMGSFQWKIQWVTFEFP